MQSNTLQEIIAHAVAEYPRESCGLVIAEGRKEVYIRCANVASDPENTFEISPADWQAAEDRGSVLLVAHSHPGGTPVPTTPDRAACSAVGVPWAIIAVHTDPARPEAGAFYAGHMIMTPDGYRAPLRGREFIFGVQDCYTLVQDYYREEMGVTLPDFDRTDKFWERGENLYMDNFKSAGFELIDAPTQKGDVILMAIRSDIVNHAGIWLGERDAMLHHPYQHLSEKVTFGGFWLEHTRAFIRRVSNG